MSSMDAPLVVLLRLARDLLADEINAEVQRAAPELRPAHGSILEPLGFKDGLRLTDLAHGAGMTPQAAGELVDQLEALGYVERRPDPTDRRAKRIYCTDRAHVASRAAYAATGRIDAELAQLLGAGRMAELEQDLVRIIESRGGTVTPPIPRGEADSR